MKNLARYIIRASFSQERMQYLADERTVIYSAKDGKARKIFDAPEWLAAMCSHVPNGGSRWSDHNDFKDYISNSNPHRNSKSKAKALCEKLAIPPAGQS